ncbi:hypothetical protein M431DRAFT_523733 [Trichoderma harzianum CBS 226.95]|uniref:Uncharacterized protein n=1 Tax=Trichoderma harzianum CBS 226.95 TaxID=983964 RepID=A0A2T3ZZY3_TRIHA|nr:hypothetical protein M431DRAFT_523733 [Trichoderma harzianum CBS 226.95]PTB50374.1 hypothetical protein M431DRAFT_523733 [Trichoderma harzianum CBS 226.95]
MRRGQIKPCKVLPLDLRPSRRHLLKIRFSRFCLSAHGTALDTRMPLFWLPPASVPFNRTNRPLYSVPCYSLHVKAGAYESSWTIHITAHALFMHLAMRGRRGIQNGMDTGW